MSKKVLIMMAVVVLSGCSNKKQTGLRPLAELMPQLEARQTEAGMWHVWSKAYDATEWTECPTDLPSKADAEDTIASVEMELRVKYEIGKAISDAVSEALIAN